MQELWCNQNVASQSQEILDFIGSQTEHHSSIAGFNLPL